MTSEDSRGRFKRLIKLVISMGFFVASSCWKLFCRLTGGRQRGVCVVLYYHAVPPEFRRHFARQMDILLSCTKPVAAGVQLPLPDGGPYSAVTFDDGYESVIENALPELRERRIPCTIFVITEALGRWPTWLTGPDSDRELHGRVLSADQLRRLSSDMVTIASHSMTHPKLTSLSQQEASKELVGSRLKLEEMLHKQVRLFSFPYGAFNKELVRWCREAGYERVFTILPVLAFTDSQEFVTGRVWVEPTDWPLEFRLKLLGAYRWLPSAFALKQKLLSSFPVSRLLRLAAPSEEQAVPYATHRE